MKLGYDSIDRQIIREYPKSLFAEIYNLNVALHNFSKELEKFFNPIVEWLSKKLN